MLNLDEWANKVYIGKGMKNQLCFMQNFKNMFAWNKSISFYKVNSNDHIGSFESQAFVRIHKPTLTGRFKYDLNQHIHQVDSNHPSIWFESPSSWLESWNWLKV